MAVIISNGTTTLNTASGFYRVEAYNLGVFSQGGSHLALSTIRNIAVTFANSGNCLGGMVCLYGGSYADTTMKDVNYRLLQVNATCTTPVASPGVVTLAGHGYTGNEEIVFATTGTLPTGLTANTVYYVKYINANTFNVSATRGGTNINFTGSTSGTHTLWSVKALKTQTGTQNYGTASNTTGYFFIPFAWDTDGVGGALTGGYAVDTTAGKYKLHLSEGAGTNSQSWSTSDTTNPCYALYCNTAATATDNDTLIIKDQVTIDKSFTMRGVLPTGDTTNSVACLICRSLTPTPDNVALLKWENPAASAYTLTLNGLMIFGARSGFRVGTSTNKIAIAQKATIAIAAATYGTSTRSGFSDCQPGSGGSYQPVSRSSIFLYGETPTYRYDWLASDAASGQKNLVTTNATGWAPADTITVGKYDTVGYVGYEANIINTISTTNIAVTVNLGTSTRKSGAPVVNLSQSYGVEITNNTGSVYMREFANFEFSGVKTLGWSTSTGSTVNYRLYEDSANYQQHLIEKSLFYLTASVTNGTFFVAHTCHDKGIKVDDNVSYCSGLIYIDYCPNATTPVTLTNNICLSYYNNARSMLSVTGFNQYTMSGNKFYNSYLAQVGLGGVNHTVTNNYWWSFATYGAKLSNMGKPANWSGNHFDKCAIGITLGTTIGFISKNDIFGSETANVIDIQSDLNAYNTVEFNSPTGALNYSTLYQATTVPGSLIRISEDNNVANKDFTYTTYGNFVRTGDALADTTVHTSGTGKFAIRFEPTSSTTNLEWAQEIPTGDIQNKDMTIGVWCKINNAAFYANTHQMPRLTINYDNGTTAYAEAAQTTDWQFLVVPFKPTTTYGSVTATLSCRTDATSTNRYIYFDDYSVLYPAGYIMNASGLDMWSNALPVMPTISTLFSAQDVWQSQTSTMTGTGTIGKQLAPLKNANLLVGKKIL